MYMHQVIALIDCHAGSLQVHLPELYNAWVHFNMSLVFYSVYLSSCLYILAHHLEFNASPPGVGNCPAPGRQL